VSVGEKTNVTFLWIDSWNLADSNLKKFARIFQMRYLV